MKLLFEIFSVFFRIGLFTIGGGYAMLPIIQKEVVDRKHWMTDEEFLDAISLTNSLPGPLATNSATFVGYKIRRVSGAIAAVLGAALPSVLIILAVAMVFLNITDNVYVQAVFTGIRPVVVALILYSVVTLARSAKLKQGFGWLLAALAFVAVAVAGIHPILVILAAAAFGLAVNRKKEEEKEGQEDGSVH